MSVFLPGIHHRLQRVRTYGTQMALRQLLSGLKLLVESLEQMRGTSLDAVRHAALADLVVAS